MSAVAAGGLRGLDKGEQALAVLSDFWNTWFKDKKVLRDYVHAQNFDVAQSYFDLMEGVLSTSLVDIPVFHKEMWYNLVLLEELAQERDGGVWRHPLPKSMIKPGRGLYNRIYQPSLALSENTDYYIQGIWIYFKENPFLLDNVAAKVEKDPVTGASHKRISLWCLESSWDDNLLYDNYGYLLNQPGKSSQIYKSFLQGIWRLYANGPTVRNIETAANVILGIPICRTDGELVKEISFDTATNEQIIITSANYYRIPGQAPLRDEVFVGAELVLNAPLTKIVEVTDHVIDPTWTEDEGFRSTIVGALAKNVPPLEIPAIDPNAPFVGQEVQSVLYQIGDVWNVNDGSMFVGGSYFLPPGQQVLTDANGNVILNFDTPEAIEVISGTELIAFNSFRLRVNGNVGSDYLAYQNQVKEIIRTGLPAYTDFLYRVFSDLSDDYDCSAIAEDIIRSIKVMAPPDTYGDFLDELIIVTQAIKKLLQDSYLDTFTIGNSAPVVGAAEKFIGEGMPVDETVYGAREYRDPVQPKDFVDTEDAAPKGAIAYTGSDVYGHGVASILEIGAFAIDEDTGIRLGDPDPSDFVYSERITIKLRSHVQEQYLGMPWEIGDELISPELQVNAGGTTDDIVVGSLKYGGSEEYSGTEDAFNSAIASANAITDDYDRADDLGATGPTLRPAVIRDTYNHTVAGIGFSDSEDGAQLADPYVIGDESYMIGRVSTQTDSFLIGNDGLDVGDGGKTLGTGTTEDVINEQINREITSEDMPGVNPPGSMDIG